MAVSIAATGASALSLDEVAVAFGKYDIASKAYLAQIQANIAAQKKINIDLEKGVDSAQRMVFAASISEQLTKRLVKATSALADLQNSKIKGTTILGTSVTSNAMVKDQYFSEQDIQKVLDAY